VSVATILASATDHLHALFKAPGRLASGALLHGDCIDIMACLPDSSLRGIVTSPPYNLRNSLGNGLHDGRRGARKNPRRTIRQGRNGLWRNGSGRDGSGRDDPGVQPPAEITRKYAPI